MPTETSNVWTTNVDQAPRATVAGDRIPFSHSRPRTSTRSGCYGSGEVGAEVESLHANGNATVVCTCGDRFVVPARFVQA